MEFCQSEKVGTLREVRDHKIRRMYAIMQSCVNKNQESSTTVTINFGNVIIVLFKMKFI